MPEFKPTTVEVESDGQTLTFHRRWVIECGNRDAHQRAVREAESAAEAEQRKAELAGCGRHWTTETHPDETDLECPHCGNVVNQSTRGDHYTQHIEYEGETYTPSFDLIHECEHEDCGYQWRTDSGSRRPTCPACHRKTDRLVVGGHREDYLKYQLFSGNEESGEEVITSLRSQANSYEAMLANGWTLACTSSSSHVILVSGSVDADQFEIIA